MFVVSVSWTYQKTKFVMDTLGGHVRPDGDPVEQHGVITGYVVKDDTTYAVVIVDSFAHRDWLEEHVLSDLTVVGWRACE